MRHNLISGNVTRRARQEGGNTPNWLKAVYALLATIVILAALGMAFGSTSGGDSLKPCKSEDSTHCYWDAEKNGNHKGSDFIVHEGRTFYPAK
jgi:hypothetical protein